MKTKLIFLLLLSSALVHGQSDLDQALENYRSNREDDNVMRDHGRQQAEKDAAALAGIVDPPFKAFLQQNFAKWFVSPYTGNFTTGPYRGKSQAYAISALQKQFYGGAPKTGLGTTDDGTGFGHGKTDSTEWTGKFGSGRSDQPTPVAATPAPKTQSELWAESAKKAGEMYPAALDPDSALTAKIREISKQLKDQNSAPILPLTVVQIAAAVLGIKPATPIASK